MADVEPKVILVTGGSRGIGAATGRLAADRGYAVCVNYHRAAAEAEALIDEIKRDGGTAIAVCGDVSELEDVCRLFATVDRELGTLTALVNNAGIPGERGRLADLDATVLRRVLEVNAMGVMLCAQQAVRRMSTRAGGAGGAIVNVSSLAAKSGGEGLTAYVASKGAVEAFTLGLAREVAAVGIRVNAVSPGFIATDQQPLDDGAWVKRTSAAIPLGRLGTTEEVAEAILWLLSDEATYITGAILPVTGGR